MASRDQANVRALFEQVVRGWNERNAALTAAAFADDGVMVGYDGGETFGKADIERSMASIFADHEPGRWAGIIRSVTFPAPDVGILYAVSAWVQPAHTDSFPKGVQLMTSVRAEAGWRIASLQTTPAQYHGFPDKAKALEVELRAAAAKTASN